MLDAANKHPHLLRHGMARILGLDETCDRVEDPDRPLEPDSLYITGLCISCVYWQLSLERQVFPTMGERPRLRFHERRQGGKLTVEVDTHGHQRWMHHLARPARSWSRRMGGMVRAVITDHNGSVMHCAPDAWIESIHAGTFTWEIYASDWNAGDRWLRC